MASRWAKGVGLAVAAAVGLTACSSGDGSDASGGEPVVIEFWGSAINQEKTIDIFNAAHDDVQINYTAISAGSAGGYEKMLNASHAGNAPCLGQVSYDTVPSFAAAGALEDITEYASSSEDLFAPAAWQLGSLGGAVYGVPVDLGPMALYYRADLFDQYGISAPETWDEFRSAAEAVHAADPEVYLTTLPQNAYDVGALAWQAGGQWFGTENDEWQVSINDEPTQQVASYWQGLLDDQLVVSEPAFDTAWFNSVQEGRLLSFVGAAWAVELFEENLPGLAGQLAVAKLPQWDAADSYSGSRGGSATVVLSGCDHPKEAAQAAIWLSTDDDSVNSQITNTGLFPASLSGLELPVLQESSDYFGGQQIYDVFTEAARNIPDDWVWGPTMTQVQPDFDDGLKRVGAGQDVLPDLVDAVQQQTVDAMSDEGFAVTG